MESGEPFSSSNRGIDMIHSRSDRWVLVFSVVLVLLFGSVSSGKEKTLLKAQSVLREANQETVDPVRQKKLREEALALYRDARRFYLDRAKNLQSELGKFRGLNRNKLRAEYLQVQQLAAMISEEMADVYVVGSEQYNEHLLSAANEYRDIYEKYRTRLAGLYAQMFRARCYVKLQQYDQGLKHLNDLLDYPVKSELRDLRTKSLVLASQCWLDKSKKRYELAIKNLAPHVESIKPFEEQRPDWLALRYYLSQAYKSHGDQLQAAKGDAAKIAESHRKAQQHAQWVARHKGEFQKKAQTLLRLLKGDDE